MKLVEYSFSLTGHKTKREKKQALIEALQNMPQYIPVTRNYFADGLCVRECEMPKNTVGVGVFYKKSHILTISKGHIQIDLEGKLLDIKAPTTIRVEAGTQKAISALEDSIFCVSFGTKNTTIEDVCAEFTTSNFEETIGQPKNIQALKNKELAWQSF
jgi:hypothetical protein